MGAGVSSALLVSASAGADANDANANKAPTVRTPPRCAGVRTHDPSSAHSARSRLTFALNGPTSTRAVVVEAAVARVGAVLVCRSLGGRARCGPTVQSCAVGASCGDAEAGGSTATDGVGEGVMRACQIGRRSRRPSDACLRIGCQIPHIRRARTRCSLFDLLRAALSLARNRRTAPSYRHTFLGCIRCRLSICPVGPRSAAHCPLGMLSSDKAQGNK